MKIVVWNILDLIDEYGEDSTKEVLSAFSCERDINGKSKSLNPDIEHFIKNNAIQFARQKVSVSYIVGDEDDGSILGYFTITHKPVEMPADGLSKTTMKTMNRYAELDTEKNSFLVSGFLIAQFGKNYAVDDGARISGKELMRLANKELFDLQHRAGGGMRLSQDLCKPPMWCRIGVPHWRFNYEQQKEPQSAGAGTSGKNPGAPASRQYRQHGGYPEPLQGNHRRIYGGRSGR